MIRGRRFLYLQTFPSSGTDLVSFYVDDFQLTYVAPPTIQTNIPSIFKTLSEFFPVGAEVDTTDLSGPHSQLLDDALQQHRFRERYEVEFGGEHEGELHLWKC